MRKTWFLGINVDYLSTPTMFANLRFGCRNRIKALRLRNL